MLDTSRMTADPRPSDARSMELGDALKLLGQLSGSLRDESANPGSVAPVGWLSHTSVVPYLRAAVKTLTGWVIIRDAAAAEHNVFVYEVTRQHKSVDNGGQRSVTAR
jgi:hypothetical protein